MKVLLFLIPAALLLTGCGIAGNAVRAVAQPVGGLLNVASGPARGLAN